MATVVGYEPNLLKRFTCHNCTAIVEYKPSEVIHNGQTDEGTWVQGLYCPECDTWHRTNSYYD